MKNLIHIALKAFGVILIIQIYSCAKNETTDLDYGIDPTTQESLLCKSLRLQGNNKDGNMPIGVGTGFPVTMSPPSVVEISAGVLLFLPYIVSDTSKVCNLYLQVEGADNYWETKLITDPSSKKPYFKILIPKFVRDGDFNFVFTIADCNGNVSRKYSTKTIVSPSGDCNTSINGSVGITIRTFDLGDKAGRASFSCEMYSIPDRLDIRYNGNWIASTGQLFNEKVVIPDCDNKADGFVSGKGKLSLDYNPKVSRIVEVYISGCNSGTEWKIDPICPSDKDWFANLPPCPCTYEEVLKLRKTKNPDGNWSDCEEANQKYHFGATKEVRWLPTSSGMAGQQCTYDANGKLITSGIAAGSPDKVSPGSCGSLTWESGSHYIEDVRPWSQKSCLEYLNEWPSNNGNICSPNPVSDIQHMKKLTVRMTCEEVTALLKGASESKYVSSLLKDFLLGKNKNAFANESDLLQELRSFHAKESCPALGTDFCQALLKAIRNMGG